MPSPEEPLVPASWAGRTFAALRVRDYRLFFAGMALSSVGTWGRHTAQQWLVATLTGDDPRWLAWTSACGLLALAVVSVPAGALVDRVGKRRLLLAVQVGSMTLSAALAALVLTGVATPLHVLLLTTGLGVLAGVEMPCRQAFLVDLVGRAGLPNAIALNSVMFNLPLVVGPAVAARMMEGLGVGSVFVLDAASYLATVAAFALIRAEGRPHPEAPRRPLDALLEGARFVRRDATVRRVLLLLAAAMVFGWSYSALLAAYARTALAIGSDASRFGDLYLSSGVGACLAALWVAGRPRGRPGPTLAACLAAFAASMLALAATTSYAVAVAARTAAGFSMIVFFATGNATIQMSVPDAIRGRVMSLWTSTFALSLPLGQLLLGEAAARTSVRAAYAGGGACLLATAAVALATRRGQRSRSTA